MNTRLRHRQYWATAFYEYAHEDLHVVLGVPELFVPPHAITLLDGDGHPTRFELELS